MAVKSTFFNFPSTQYKYRFQVQAPPAETDHVKIEVEDLTPAQPGATPPVAGTGKIKVTIEAKSPGIKLTPASSATCFTNFSLGLEVPRCTLANPMKGGTADGKIGTPAISAVWTRSSVPRLDVETYSVDFTYPAPGKYGFNAIIRANELFERPMKEQSISAKEVLP